MVTKTTENLVAILEATVACGYIVQVARAVHIDRTNIFRWIAASEKSPDKWMTEWQDAVLPFHQQIKRARQLGRVGHDYFEEAPTERDAVIRERMIESGMADESLPARVTTNQGVPTVGRGKIPNVRRVSYWERQDKVAAVEAKRAAAADRLKTLVPDDLNDTIDVNDDPLLSDLPSDGMRVVDADHPAVRVLAGVDPGQQLELGRARRAEAIPEGAEIAVQEPTGQDARQEPTTAPELTPRQRAAAVARARIEQRISRGGAPMSDIERDLLASLEQPSNPSRPQAIVSSIARPAAPQPSRSGLMDDPSEGITGRSGGPRAGGIKMR